MATIIGASHKIFNHFDKMIPRLQRHPDEAVDEFLTLIEETLRDNNQLGWRIDSDATVESLGKHIFCARGPIEEGLLPDKTISALLTGLRKHGMVIEGLGQYFGWMHRVFYTQHPEEMAVLVNAGFNANLVSFGDTVLHRYFMASPSPTGRHGASIDEIIPLLDGLISNHLDINAKNAKNNTVLHNAFEYFAALDKPHIEVFDRQFIYALEDRGANLATRNNRGFTAFGYGCFGDEKRRVLGSIGQQYRHCIRDVAGERSQIQMGEHMLLDLLVEARRISLPLLDRRFTFPDQECNLIERKSFLVGCAVDLVRDGAHPDQAFSPHWPATLTKWRSLQGETKTTIRKVAEELGCHDFLASIDYELIMRDFTRPDPEMEPDHESDFKLSTSI